MDTREVQVGVEPAEPDPEPPPIPELDLADDVTLGAAEPDGDAAPVAVTVLVAVTAAVVVLVVVEQVGTLAAFCARLTASCASSTRDPAESTDACASPGSMRANTCPAVTVSPGLIFTSVTVPDTLKARPRVWADWIVPAAATARVTVPRCTVVVDDANGTASPAWKSATAVTAPTAQTAATVDQIARRLDRAVNLMAAESGRRPSR